MLQEWHRFVYSIQKEEESVTPEEENVPAIKLSDACVVLFMVAQSRLGENKLMAVCYKPTKAPRVIFYCPAGGDGEVGWKALAPRMMLFSRLVYLALRDECAKLDTLLPMAREEAWRSVYLVNPCTIPTVGKTGSSAAACAEVVALITHYSAAAFTLVETEDPTHNGLLIMRDGTPAGTQALQRIFPRVHEPVYELSHLGTPACCASTPCAWIALIISHCSRTCS